MPLSDFEYANFILDISPSSQPLQQMPAREDLQQMAITEEDHALIDEFHRQLAAVEIEFCEICNERWFDMKVNDDGICQRCRNHKPGEVPRFTKINKLHPGPSIQKLAVEYGLPIPEPLSQIEEMLISKVQCTMQVYSIKGGQNKYAGHCCNFVRHNANLLAKVPILPENLDILIVRPKPRNNEPIDNSLATHPSFHVNRKRMLDTLRVLEKSHPSYINQNIIDYEAINNLPEDGSIFDRLWSVEESTIQRVGSDQGPQAAAGEEGEDGNNVNMVSEGFVPDVTGSRNEIDEIRSQLDMMDDTLTMPSMRGTPINEHDTNIQYFIDAFPTLYPTGEADLRARRCHAVTTEDYFRHLLRWDDGRFARHPRFRYFALNTIMRWQSKRLARVYAKRNKNDARFTVGDLRELMGGDLEKIAARISRGGVNLRGTRPYWLARRRELIAMIKDCGCPHLFFTFSAADVQWPDLHRHMPHPVSSDATEQERAKIHNQNLNENPGIAAYWFQKRFDIFFKTVIAKKFKLKEHWFRYEWQHRGSSHIHGFVWIDDAPDVSTLDLQNVDSVQEFIRFWDPLISTINPAKDEPKAPVHPSARDPTILRYDLQELAQLLNRVQRHIKCTSYCLRHPKGAPKDTEKVSYLF